MYFEQFWFRISFSAVMKTFCHVPPMARVESTKLGVVDNFWKVAKKSFGILTSRPSFITKLSEQPSKTFHFFTTTINRKRCPVRLLIGSTLIPLHTKKEHSLVCRESTVWPTRSIFSLSPLTSTPSYKSLTERERYSLQKDQHHTNNAPLWKCLHAKGTYSSSMQPLRSPIVFCGTCWFAPSRMSEKDRK